MKIPKPDCRLHKMLLQATSVFETPEINIVNNTLES